MNNLRRELSWLDCVSLIIGIILGTGIFVVFPSLTAGANPSVVMILLAWVLGGIIAWFGAICFAELSCYFPQNGGDYIFLREAYKWHGYSPVGFLFAWTQILVIRPASLASLAIVLGLNFKILFFHYCRFFYHETPPEVFLEAPTILFILLSVIFFTYVSIRGITISKNLQNVLSVLKMILLLMLIVIGFVLGKDQFDRLTPMIFPENFGLWESFRHLGIALIPVMWVYGGWNEAPYVAGEMAEPEKNIPKAFATGILTLGVLYVLVNFVYLLHLSPKGLASSGTFASDLMKVWFGSNGEIIMAFIIFISAAGAMNGLVFTGGRITQAFAKDITVFTSFSRVHPVWHTPSSALLLNLVITLSMLGIVGGRPENLEKLLFFTSGVVWIFFGLVVISLSIVKKRVPKEKRHYESPFYPVSAIVFLVMCCLMIKGAYDYKKNETLMGIGVLLAGIPLYYISLFVKNKFFFDPDSKAVSETEVIES